VNKRIRQNNTGEKGRRREEEREEDKDRQISA
jgi:hypothetical protein